MNNTTSIKQVIITQSINNKCQFHSVLPNFKKSPILKNLIKKKKKPSYWSIEQHSKHKTCYNHSIYQSHRSILSNLAQIHEIPKSLKNIRTLISKFLINNKNFEIKACETFLYDAWTKTHYLVSIKMPKNIKTPIFSMKNLKKMHEIM